MVGLRPQVSLEQALAEGEAERGRLTALLGAAAQHNTKAQEVQGQLEGCQRKLKKYKGPSESDKDPLYTMLSQFSSHPSDPLYTTLSQFSSHPPWSTPPLSRRGCAGESREEHVR